MTPVGGTLLLDNLVILAEKLEKLGFFYEGGQVTPVHGLVTVRKLESGPRQKHGYLRLEFLESNVQICAKEK